jgi:hypothetical protein
VTDRSTTITSKGKRALAAARLERSWENVPPPTQARLIAAIAAVADDYAPVTATINEHTGTIAEQDELVKRGELARVAFPCGCARVCPPGWAESVRKDGCLRVAHRAADDEQPAQHERAVRVPLVGRIAG